MMPWTLREDFKMKIDLMYAMNLIYGIDFEGEF